MEKKEENEQGSNVYYLRLIFNISCTLQAFLPLFHNKLLYFEDIVNHNPPICCSYFSGLSSLLHCMWVISWLTFLAKGNKTTMKRAVCRNGNLSEFLFKLKKYCEDFLDKKNYSEWQLQWKTKQKFCSFNSYLELGGLPALLFSICHIKYWPQMIEQTCFKTSF